MTSLLSAATASFLVHHLPIATLHGVFSSAISLAHNFPSLITQHVHNGGYYYGAGPSHGPYYGGPACDPCDVCACCIMLTECLCLTAVCCPVLCPMGMVATSNFGTDEDNIETIQTVRNDSKKKVWASVSEALPSLADIDDISDDEA